MSVLLSFLVPFIIIGSLGYIIYYGFRKYSENYNQSAIFVPFLFSFTAAVVIVWNIFDFETQLGIGTSLFLSFFFISLNFIFPQKKKRTFFYLSIILGIAASLFLGFRANDYMLGLNTTLIILDLIFLVVLFSADAADTHIISWFQGLWAQFFAMFKQAKVLMLSSSKTQLAGKFNVMALIKTSVISILLISIFIALLSDADPVFAELVEWFLGDVVERLLSSLFLALMLIWFFTIKVQAKSPIKTNLSFLSYYDIFIPVLLVEVVFAIFLGIQVTYLFAGAGDLSTFDLTYSEYVRKGFAELLIAGFFGSVISMLILLKREHTSEKESRILRFLNIVLVIELFLILLSALKRDLLYIDAYGLTRIRLIGGVFLFWLSGTYLLIALKDVFDSIKKYTVFLLSILLAGIFYLSLNIINIDQSIVKYNEKYGLNDDVFYTSLLSADAVSGWGDGIIYSAQWWNEFQDKSLIKDNDKKEFVNIDLAIDALRTHKQELEIKYAPYDAIKSQYFAQGSMSDYEKQKRKWQSMNFSEKSAFQYMQEHSDVFDVQLECLDTEIQLYPLVNNLDLQEIRMDRSANDNHPFTQSYHINYWNYYSLEDFFSEFLHYQKTQEFRDPVNIYKKERFTEIFYEIQSNIGTLKEGQSIEYQDDLRNSYFEKFKREFLRFKVRGC